MKAWRAGLAALAVTSILAGCGEDSPVEVASPAPGPARVIELTSPAVGPDGVISPRVSCGSGTIWLPLKWGSLPSETKELILYFGRFKRGAVDGAQEVKVPFAAIITDISPKLRGMAANTFPAGAEFLYFVSIANCPPVRNGQHFLVELFALDHRREVPQDDPFAVRLAEEALGVEEFASDSEAASEFRGEALATGRFIATYAPL